MARLFLIPVILCLIWIGFLQLNGYSLKQGKKGFIVIAIGSAALCLFLTLMLWLTKP
jgi:prophage maintenance system killer protein